MTARLTRDDVTKVALLGRLKLSAEEVAQGIKERERGETIAYGVLDPSAFAQGGRIVTASAVDWSDTATFLLQAEVFHTSIVSEERISYPVVFGRGFNFTVPPTAEGVSLVAEVGGVEIVFPLASDLYMSWAACDARKGSNASNSVYQCELKPDYRF